MEHQDIINHLPYAAPFLFVDALHHLDEEGAKGSFTFHKDLDFFKGHFKSNPVTPGVILTECCAQIGLVCFGIYLLGDTKTSASHAVAMSSSKMEFYLPVHPGEKVEVHSKKLYHRFNKLKCSVKMYNQNKELVCTGVLAGMLKINKYE